MAELSERECWIALLLMGPAPYQRVTDQQWEDMAHDAGVTVERIKQQTSKLLATLRGPVDRPA